jgi:hypothetical protein
MAIAVTLSWRGMKKGSWQFVTPPDTGYMFSLAGAGRKMVC